MKRRFVLGLGLIVLVLGVLSRIRISALVSAADPDDGVSARDLAGAETEAAGVGFGIVYEPGSPSPISLATSLFSDGTNIGIGTAAPGARLHVAEGGWILGSSDGPPVFGVSGWLTSDAGNLIEGGGGAWANHFSAYGGGDIARFGTSTGLGQEPDTKVVIGNNGGVGIGTESPQASLHVRRDDGVGEGFSTLAIFDRVGGFGGENGGALIAYHSDGSAVDFSSLFFLGGADGAIRLFDDSEGQPITRVYIQADDGNVGIGTETPQGRLHVAEGGWILGSSDAPPPPYSACPAG